MSTNFAKEFRLYESLFSNQPEEAKLEEGLADTIKMTVNKIGNNVNPVGIDLITKQVIHNIEKQSSKPAEAEFQWDDELTVYTSKTNGRYEIKKEHTDLVDKINTLANLINDQNRKQGYNSSISSNKIFKYLLSVLRIPFKTFRYINNFKL